MKKIFIALSFLVLVPSISFAQLGDGWPDGHAQILSQSWPDSHMKGYSGTSNFPANHMVVISKTWLKGDRGNGPIMYEPGFPIDHSGPTSNKKGSGFQNGGWGMADEDFGPWPANHWYAVSRSWWRWEEKKMKLGVPYNYYHTKSDSKTWRHVPNHSKELSRAWPNEHDHTISWQWPTGHKKNSSLLGLPLGKNDHNKHISSDYNRIPKHLDSVSKFWSPNHYRRISQSFPIGHHRGASASWPANHNGLLSNTWPLGADWPPNHAKSSSIKWAEPNDPGWPLFPSDHSWFTTTTAIVGVASDVSGMIPEGAPKK